jgi:hypothetical protein
MHVALASMHLELTRQANSHGIIVARVTVKPHGDRAVILHLNFAGVQPPAASLHQGYDAAQCNQGKAIDSHDEYNMSTTLFLY